MRVDLSDWDATIAALESLPPMNGVVNNAGLLNTRTPILETTKAEVDRVMAVNFYGALNVTQVMGRRMVEAGKGGSIVNVSSIYGIQPHPGFIPYSASKAAMDMLTKMTAVELGAHKIRVNSVNPTYMLTDMTKAVITDCKPGTIGAKVIAETPLGHLGEVEDTVNFVLFLLSDLSSMVSATTNLVDGSFLGHCPGI